MARLPPDDVTVLTTPYAGAAEWDAEQAFRIVRTKSKVLLPTPALARRIDDLADEFEAPLVVLDPALPLGLVGPHLRHPYGLVLHGAEVTVPGRLPVTRLALRRVLRGAKVVICAGGYPLAEAERAAGRTLPATNIPPGVDVERFRPLSADERIATRAQFGLPTDAPVVLGISRLVPRKGFDTLLRACGQLAGHGREFVVAIAGQGRDRDRLERIATEARAPARFLGRVDDDSLPALYGASGCLRDALPQSLGRASNRRASASCSSRRRPPVCRRWPASVAERPRRSPTARPVSCSTRRTMSMPSLARSRRCWTTMRRAPAWPRPRVPARSTSSRTTSSSPAFRPRSTAWEDDGVVKAREEDLDAPPEGESIINASWAGTGVYVALAVAGRSSRIRSPHRPAIVSGALFVIGCVAFFWAYAVAVSRSRTDLIGIGGLYFLAGTAPKVVRFRLRLSLALEIVAALVSSSIRPFTPMAFGFLVPVFGLGMCGLWGARHGTFEPRPAPEPKADQTK